MQLLFILIPGKVLALLIGIFYLRSLSTPYRLLLLQVIIALFFESYGYYLGMIKNQNNAWAFYYYLLIDSWLMGIAGNYFIENKILKRSVPFLLVLTSAIWVFDLWSNGFNVLPNRFLVCYSILLVIIYISVLFNKAFINTSILKSPLFWIAISTILYYSCIIPFIGLWNLILKTSPKLADQLFNINLVLNFIRYPLVALSFYLYGKQQQRMLNEA